jgi:predicted nucleotidyltransferase
MDATDSFTKEDARDRLIFRSLVGSRMWGMEHEGSDYDYHMVYLEPTERFLGGTANKTTYDWFEDIAGDEYDFHLHEIEHTLNLICKGNINNTLRLLSPKVEYADERMWNLREIVEENLSLSLFDSAKGMALSSYHKYEGTEDANPHRAAKILRIVRCVKRVFRDEGLWFYAVNPETVKWNDILDEVDELEEAKGNSTLQEEPDEERLRNWLVRLRQAEQRGGVKSLL